MDLVATFYVYCFGRRLDIRVRYLLASNNSFERIQFCRCRLLNSNYAFRVAIEIEFLGMASLPCPQMGCRKLHLPPRRLLAPRPRRLSIHPTNPGPVDRQ